MATTAEPAGELMSGIDVIRNDHEAIRQLFRSYQGSTDRDVKLSVARELVTTVSRHASAEERTIYPMITSIIPPTQGAKHLYDMMVLDDTVNKEVLSYLDTHVPQTDSEWALFDQTVDKFIMIEEEHMTKEEKRVLDVMDRSMTRDEKADLYTKFKAASANAPLHPHQPTSAYAAQVLHPVAGMVDRAAHAVTGMVNKVLHPADKTAAAAHQGTEQGKQHTV